MSNKKSSISDVSKAVAIIVIGGLIATGLLFGFSSLYYILPVFTVLIVIVNVVYNVNNEKKITLEQTIYGIITIAIVATILVGIGSLFYRDTDEVRDVRMERVNMGLPMY